MGREVSDRHVYIPSCKGNYRSPLENYALLLVLVCTNMHAGSFSPKSGGRGVEVGGAIGVLSFFMISPRLSKKIYITHIQEQPLTSTCG